MEPITMRHLTGSRSGQVSWFELNHNDELTIGRDPSNKLAFHHQEDDLVGRRHAKIVCHADGFVIVDLNSRNGTFVNNKRLTGSMPLKPGDVIEFGTGGPKVQFDQGIGSLVGPATRTLQSSQPQIRPTRFASVADLPSSERVARAITKGAEAQPTHSSPRTLAIGVWAALLLIVAFVVVTLLQEPTPPPITGGQAEPTKTFTLGELWPALAAHRQFVFFAGALLLIAVILGLFNVRRDD